MPDPHLRITRRVVDEPYGWAASYGASVMPGQVALALRLQLQSGPGVTDAGLAQVRRETGTAVAQYFDHRFVVEEDNNRPRPVRISVEFVTANPDLSVTVHAGSGRDNLQHWFVNSGVIARAHEVGHAFGLKDEYADALAPNRATMNAPGVYQDHSLMGDFEQEGIRQAELKPRHAVEMVRGLAVHFRNGFRVIPAGAAINAVRLKTGSEAANAGATADSIQTLRELAQRLDTHRPGQGRSGRLHR